MKLLNIKSIFLVALTAFMVSSCSESDKVIDQVTDNEQRGAILRQSNIVNSVAIDSDTGELKPGQKFASDLEYQDHENGNLLSETNVYLSFVDKTDDEVDNSKSEVLYETIPASDFVEGSRGLPTFSYEVSAEDMLSALGLEEQDLGTGGDDFIVRFEVVLTDGRSFSFADNSGTITGSYFSSPFRNLVDVVCGPTRPTAGTWTFVTVDSYGDGWNGASLEIVLDGAAAGSIINDGSTGTDPQTFEFNVPEGTEVISIKYVAGAWDSEVSFTITSANGNEVVNITPEPPAGVELLDYCKGGL